MECKVTYYGTVQSGLDFEHGVIKVEEYKTREEACERAGEYNDTAKKLATPNTFNAVVEPMVTARDYAYELFEALKSMLYTFDRGLTPNSIGDMTCDKARKLIAKMSYPNREEKRDGEV